MKTSPAAKIVETRRNESEVKKKAWREMAESSASGVEEGENRTL
jgi:hypothetical protein